MIQMLRLQLCSLKARLSERGPPPAARLAAAVATMQTCIRSRLHNFASELGRIRRLLAMFCTVADQYADGQHVHDGLLGDSGGELDELQCWQQDLGGPWPSSDCSDGGDDSASEPAPLSACPSAPSPAVVEHQQHQNQQHQNQQQYHHSLMQAAQQPAPLPQQITPLPQHGVCARGSGTSDQSGMHHAYDGIVTDSGSGVHEHQRQQEALVGGRWRQYEQLQQPQPELLRADKIFSNGGWLTLPWQPLVQPLQPQPLPSVFVPSTQFTLPFCTGSRAVTSSTQQFVQQQPGVPNVRGGGNGSNAVVSTPDSRAEAPSACMDETAPKHNDAAAGGGLCGIGGDTGIPARDHIICASPDASAESASGYDYGGIADGSDEDGCGESSRDGDDDIEELVRNPDDANTDTSGPSPRTRKKTAGTSSNFKGVSRQVLKVLNCMPRANDEGGLSTLCWRAFGRHRHTNKWEAHLWDSTAIRKKSQSMKRARGKQIYLGSYETELEAARAYDIAAIVFWGSRANTNLPLEFYSEEIESLSKMSKEDVVNMLRRQSSGLSRGGSKYRGVTPHRLGGTYEARIACLYLGCFGTAEAAAMAYDFAALHREGLNAMTNFDPRRYIEEGVTTRTLRTFALLPEAVKSGFAKNIKTALGPEQSLATANGQETCCGMDMGGDDQAAASKPMGVSSGMQAWKRQRTELAQPPAPELQSMLRPQVDVRQELPPSFLNPGQELQHPPQLSYSSAAALEVSLMVDGLPPPAEPAAATAAAAAPVVDAPYLTLVAQKAANATGELFIREIPSGPTNKASDKRERLSCGGTTYVPASIARRSGSHFIAMVLMGNLAALEPSARTGQFAGYGTPTTMSQTTFRNQYLPH
ncbi:pathogenesis-related genes transcriptional activator [Volvox carteri f. nagariensis]|uniref:Pathogenesis-related genes transcriptional activator n=1 Tax=Volvox carteri f. nagariensis TaxID=3068 RepID=D8TVK2_VOLCA|nr:pathogenesis-related genes transcriptional activator [Volvox carteri f. nagariensis]EFJ48595.1 pathogenesis-related genes transcriptional activator [Volvox carteri f. nagariensis]|eukprot:XP_002950394.1 pathogenesis-related genes transcriptional activator [Volvox carteri f. nagariensis]